jgi:hypothetical protein
MGPHPGIYNLPGALAVVAGLTKSTKSFPQSAFADLILHVAGRDSKDDFPEEAEIFFLNLIARN